MKAGCPVVAGFGEYQVRCEGQVWIVAAMLIAFLTSLPGCACCHVGEPAVEPGVQIEVGRGTAQVVTPAGRTRVSVEAQVVRAAVVSGVQNRVPFDVIRLTVGDESLWFSDVEPIIDGIEFPVPLTREIVLDEAGNGAPVVVPVSRREVESLAERYARKDTRLSACVELAIEGRDSAGFGPWVGIVGGPHRFWEVQTDATGWRRVVVPGWRGAADGAVEFCEVLARIHEVYPTWPVCLGWRGDRRRVGGRDALAVIRGLVSSGWASVDLSGRAR